MDPLLTRSKARSEDRCRTDRRGAGLFELSDLSSIEGNLSKKEKVFFVNDRNDFLLRQRDVGGWWIP
jgi:hypothetical protein